MEDSTMTMTRVALSLLVVGIAGQAQAEPEPPKKARVVAYAMNLEGKGRPECMMPLKDGAPCKTVKQPGKTLTAAQAKRLSALFGKRRSFGQAEPKCFIPHHAFVFYDKDGKVERQVSVCFMCSNLRAEPPLRKQPEDPMKSALSDRSVKVLRGLCKELGLPRCDATMP
jgi:hypothetical protein